MVLIVACILPNKNVKATPVPKIEGKSDTKIFKTYKYDAHFYNMLGTDFVYYYNSV